MCNFLIKKKCFQDLIFKQGLCIKQNGSENERNK